MTIRDTKICSTAGTLDAGGVCAHTVKKETDEMTKEEFRQFLEGTPQNGPAICMDPETFKGWKNNLEIACRLLGKACTYSEESLLQTPK